MHFFIVTWLEGVCFTQISCVQLQTSHKWINDKLCLAQHPSMCLAQHPPKHNCRITWKCLVFWMRSHTSFFTTITLDCSSGSFGKSGMPYTRRKVLLHTQYVETVVSIGFMRNLKRKCVISVVALSLLFQWKVLDCNCVLCKRQSMTTSAMVMLQTTSCSQLLLTQLI